MLLQYLNRVCIAFSIFVNVLFGGKINQTVSATQWQRKRDGKINFVFLVNFLFFKETNHCCDAWIKWQIIHRAINHYNLVGEVFFEERRAKRETYNEPL